MNLRTSFIAVLSFISITAFAKTQKFDVKVNLTVNGKKIAAPKLIINEGQKAQVSWQQEGEKEARFIEVVAKNDKDFGPDVIFLDLKLGHGESRKQIETEPEMLVKNNTPGHLTIIDGQTQETMQVEVTAKRL